MDQLHAYLTWCEQRIAHLIVAEGLRVGLLGVIQGPLTLTFRLRLLQPSPTALRKLLGLGPALSQTLGVRGVRLTAQPGFVALELPSPTPRTPGAEQLARHSRGLRLCVGVDAQRRPVHVDLRQHGALFWIGPSRRGKTQSMRSSLYALARANGPRLRFAVLCHARKAADWAAFAPAAGCLGIVTDPAEQERVLAWAAGDLLQHAPPYAVAVVCDDLLNLLARADLAAPLAELASMGAGLGVHLLAGTQEAGSRRGTGGAGVENNATARILYRNSNAAAAARATGQGAEGLQQLSGAKGDALLLLDGDGLRVATGLADDRVIAGLPAGDGRLRPWLQVRNHPTGAPPAATTPALEQPAPQHPPTRAAAPGRNGGTVPPVAPVAADLTAAADALFPMAKRAPTPPEAQVIARLRAQGASLNQLCRRVYGHKDDKALAWVKAAIESASDATEAAESADTGFFDIDPLEIDLGTSEGRKTVETLVAAGLLSRDTITMLVRPAADGRKPN